MEKKTAYEVIEQAGGRRAVAESLGVTHEAVRLWSHHGIPIKRVPAVARLAGVSPVDIDPEFFGDPGAAA